MSRGNFSLDRWQKASNPNERDWKKEKLGVGNKSEQRIQESRANLDVLVEMGEKELNHGLLFLLHPFLFVDGPQDRHSDNEKEKNRKNA